MKLPEMMLFFNSTPPEFSRPPPLPLVERLFVTVVFIKVVFVALKLSIPPANELLVLPETVLLITLTVAPPL